MDDAPNIEELRELAFATLPQKKSLCWLRGEKEEGELSSNDEAELSEFGMACPGTGTARPNARKRKRAVARKKKSQRKDKPADLSLSTPPVPTSNNHVTPKSNNVNSTRSTWTPAENPFLIRFFDEEDSESDEEHPRVANVTGPSTSVAPANLSREINRMRKQIAAMEQKSAPAKTTVKTSNPSSYKYTAPAAPDLESLRKQIALKESELQRQRMRISAGPSFKSPEAKTSVPSSSPDVIILAETEEPRQNGKHPREDDSNVDPNKKAKTDVQETLAAVIPSEPVAQAQTSDPVIQNLLDNRLDINVPTTGTLDVTDRLKELERQEEALDSELEVAQQLRHRCEVRERLARRAYREAQEALRLSNLECDRLLRSREVVSLRVRAAELARYSSGTFGAEEQLMLFGDPFASRPPPSDNNIGLLGNGPLRTALVPSPIMEETLKIQEKPPPANGNLVHEIVQRNDKQHSTDPPNKEPSAKEPRESDVRPVQDILVTKETLAAADDRDEAIDVENSAGRANLEVALEQPVVAANVDPQPQAKVSEEQGSSSSGYTSDRKDDEDYIGFGNEAASPADHPQVPNEKQGTSAASSLDEEDRSPVADAMECDVAQTELPVDGKDRVSQPYRMTEGLLVVFRQFTTRKEAGVCPDNGMPDDPEPVIPHDYESPLVNFRSFRTSPRFSSAFGFSTASKTWTHSLDPFKPLCKFEHRGKCNNELCPMQHQHEFELDSLQISKDLQGYHGDECLKRPTTRPPFKWTNLAADVPVYRIGTYLMRRHSFGTKSDDVYDFLSSISAVRPLPSDMPRLLDSSSDGSIFVDYSDVHKTSLDQDHTELPRDFGDVDLCLDFTLSILHYEVNNLKNSNCLKNALQILSRSLEANPQSVALWVVYLSLFYKQGLSSQKQHDMFQDAVQCNNSSYVLWSMFLNSRKSLKVQLESYEQAIISLSDANGPDRGMSSCILDMALRMLSSMAVSDSLQQIVSWTDDLVADSLQEGDSCPRRKSTSKLLRNILPCDACVLWVSCGYLVAHGSLPTEVVNRLGCKQELPSSVEWEMSSLAGEEVRGRVLKLLKCATSSGVGCLELSSSTSLEAQVLAVNYIKFLVAFEGLDRAAAECQKFMQWQPRSVELVVLSANIEKQLRDIPAGLGVFEKGISSWPSEKPGIQMLWNQYAGHTLEWLGGQSALSVLDKCASSTRELFHLPCTSKTRFKQQEPVDSLKYLSSARRDLGDKFSLRDSIFSLLNIALYEALRGNIQEAQNSLDKALTFDEGFAHCWQEYAAFWFYDVTGGSQDVTSLQRGLMNVVDRCYRQSQFTSKLRPLGREFLEDIKRYRNRCFIDNLLGTAPVNYTFVNSLLRMAFGACLVPSHPLDLKAWEDFAGGLLEVCPGNVALALALCQTVRNRLETSSGNSVAHSVWAASLLVNSLQTSFPVPSEAYWLEAADLLEQLSLEDALDGFFKQAAAAYPFSARMERRRLDFLGKKGR